MKCEICNRLLKENKEGDFRYCQGHSIFSKKDISLLKEVMLQEALEGATSLEEKEKILEDSRL